MKMDLKPLTGDYERVDGGNSQKFEETLFNTGSGAGSGIDTTGYRGDVSADTTARAEGGTTGLGGWKI